MNKIEPAICAALAVLAMTPAASAANAGQSQSHAPFACQRTVSTSFLTRSSMSFAISSSPMPQVRLLR